MTLPCARIAQCRCDDRRAFYYAVDILVRAAPVHLQSVESELVDRIAQHHTAVRVRRLFGIEVECVNVGLALMNHRRQLTAAQNAFSPPEGREARDAAPVFQDIPKMRGILVVGLSPDSARLYSGGIRSARNR